MQTSLSLLDRAGAGEDQAWRQIDQIYRPMIRRWLLLQQLQPQDADDLTQDVLLSVHKSLPRFVHPQRTGSFRAWLRTITVNRINEFWRAGKCRATTPVSEEFFRNVAELENPASQLRESWDREQETAVLQKLLLSFAREFEPKSMRAFHQLVFGQRKAAEVAEELGMTVAAVYAAKSRILAKLREEAGGLLD